MSLARVGKVTHLERSTGVPTLKEALARRFKPLYLSECWELIPGDGRGLQIKWEARAHNRPLATLLMF